MTRLANNCSADTSYYRKRLLNKSSFLTAVLLAATACLFVNTASLAQTEPVSQTQNTSSSSGGGNGNQVAPDAQNTKPTSQYFYDAPEFTNYVTQEAEQDTSQTVQEVTSYLRSLNFGDYNETYFGMEQWSSDFLISNLFANIGQLIGKWLSEFIDAWVAETVRWLTGFVRVFVLNPNIPINGMGSSGGGDDISAQVRNVANIMYNIACDLLLLLFILCIWKYWAEGAWRGGSNLMGAVGRLIFTAGLMLAWPTIYAFEIQITNEMITAIGFNDANSAAQLDVALESAVKGGLLGAAGGLAESFAPLVGSVAGGAAFGGTGGMVLGTVGGIITFVGLIVYLFLGVVLITELVYFLVLKAIQTALLVAQYMFAPIFLVFFATPDTENVTSGYVRSFVEVSLWTFVWIGLLRLLSIIVASDFNPWGKIMVAVGVLQLMIQVPSFLARAQISPMSDFISAGLITGGLLSGFRALGNMAQQRTGQFMDYMFNQRYAARGMGQSQATELGGLPHGTANPELLAQMRAGATGQALPGQPGTGPEARRNAEAQKLNTPMSEEERRKQEAERQRQLALQQQTGTAGQNQQAAANTINTPGAANTQAGNALTGAQAGMANNLAGVATPNPTTGRGPDLTTAPGVQTAATLGLADEIKNRYYHGAVGSGVMNPADKYDQAGYKHVPGKIAAVEAKMYEGNSIGYNRNANGQSMLVGDGKGHVRHMRARQGASAEEVAHLVAAAGYTGLFNEDAEAFDAARQAAINAGEDTPRNMFERMGAGFMAYNGGSFKQTATAKQRFNRALFQHAALGSEAYVASQQGNAYTDYLRGRFGAWTANDDAWMTHIMTDSSSPESPWNPNYSAATEACFKSGNSPMPENRAASANPYVMSLPAWKKKSAIPAVAKYIRQMANQQYPDAPGEVIDAAMGRLGGSLNEREVAAAHAIYVESEGADVNTSTVQSVARILEDPRVRNATEAYKALRTNIQYATGTAGSGQSNTIAARVTAYGLSSGNRAPATISQGEIDAAAGSAFNTAPLYAATQVVLDMYNAGLSAEQIQHSNIAQQAYEYHSTAQPHMMESLAVAARVLSPTDIDRGSVQTIHNMVMAGHKAYQIQRPEVWAAEAIHEVDPGIRPTPQVVDFVIANPRYVAERGNMLPRAQNDLKDYLTKHQKDN